MAKYTVTYACGHQVEVQLFGPHAERERKLAWLATQDCHACQVKAEREAAAAATEGLELPALTGSPKQVAWAESIRGNYIAAITENERCVTDKCLDMVRMVTEARFYIDRRGLDAVSFVRELIAFRKAHAGA